MKCSRSRPAARRRQTSSRHELAPFSIALRPSGKNAKAIRALLELEKAELTEDGSVKGLAEQMEKLKKAEDSKFLFDSERRILKGTKPAEASDPMEQGLTKEQFQRMGYKERLELFNNDPELYNELVSKE